MTLIKSISGIRGTIGGPAGDTLNPLDIVKFTSAYATFIRRSGASESNTIVVGRDARISGEMVKNVVCGTLMGMGYDVLNIGLATTPTTELAVTMSGAAGGIIITASHNPRQWNALKLLNEKYGIVESDFLSAELEMVPAFKAVDIGFDRSLIGAYGHDDRVDACGKLQIQQLIHDGKIDRTLLERRNERSRDAFKNGLFQRISPFGIISL